ncbi:TlpA family protein disulfide reductase [Methylomonas sp. EFPC1]|uniref:TlpA family protein disulfide reductase n=2 Tax=unclassified Methylomonas TaxID=2608980 RepID=UPI00051B290B|nr:TlpA family protein disulfide reductase [Methylomonas sp. Kb3]QBC27242.1 TlpA family protein disulfide reductase [Methylomonas sp. LW13]QSA99674.1 TlpA family protein disulfide reductase [Methylomonas sp. EFPC1]
MKLKVVAAFCLIAHCSMVLSAEIGSSVPSCPATSAYRTNRLDISAYKGKVLLIDFWATWCGPCRKAMPFLNGLRNEQLKDGFEVIGINVDEDIEAAQEYLKSAAVDYPMSFNPEGDCPRIFGVTAMPSSFIVDKQGRIRMIHLGFRDEDKEGLRKQITQLLSE